jgi:hypothetical protein
MGLTFIECHHFPRTCFNSLRETSVDQHVLIPTDCYFLTVMSETSGLKFPPLPDDYLEWTDWLDKCMNICHGTNVRHKNADQVVEDATYLGIFLMGRRWARDIEMWPARDADIQALTADAIFENAPSISPEELGFLREEEDMFHFNNAACHRKLQVTLRAALKTAVESHALYPEIRFFDRSINILDLYQGSRLLA